tara:strand:- start:15186 stop:18110 length:2925 start_codon:yes stop_codon:yes gene_type:complete
MKNLSLRHLIVVALIIFTASNAFADTNVGAYDAALDTPPNSQGWVNSYSNNGTGSLISDLGADAWQVEGIDGRAEWQITPSAATNADASSNGWSMSWTTRVVSGTYVTNYYANGYKFFLPILSINASGDLSIRLTGGGTYTLVTSTGADAYHDYEMTYNSATGTASLSFDGNVIESEWTGAASSQNIISWGNGSTATDSVANYRKVSFDIKPPIPVTPANIVSENDTANILFDGASQYLDITPDIPVIAGLSKGTILTTFKATGSIATIFSASNASEESSEFALLINGDGTLKVHARENGVFVNQTVTTLSYNDDVLHKAALIVTGSGTKIYIDGKLAGSSASSAFISSIDGINAINIGRNEHNAGGEWYFSGEILTTTIYDGAISEYDAITLTLKSTVVESYDASIADDTRRGSALLRSTLRGRSLDRFLPSLNPTAQGWNEDTSANGSSTLVKDLGAFALQTNGTGGRAGWQVTPDIETNNNATKDGWRMSNVTRVVSGSSITNFYSNGSKRFLASLSINAQGDLIAALEGGSTHTLVETTGASDYHSYSITYNADTERAIFAFDGMAVEVWNGASNSQNVINWGNGSTGVNGIANYRSVKFETIDGIPPLPYFVSDVFVGGAEGVNGTSNYRIPSFVQSPDGSLLAFIEGRPSGADPGQAGDINISLKRSVDMGRTWLPVQVIVENAGFDYSDPRPLVDKTTGTVFIFYIQWETRCAQNGNCVEPGDPNYLFYRSSTNNGVTWSAPVDISSQVKDPTWRSINSGPGQAIQLDWQTAAQGDHNDRLIFPAIVRASNSLFYVASIYSDDNGANWNRGSLTPVSGPTEADVVELTDGKLLLSARNDGGAAGSRYHFLSSDGGESWVQTTHDIAVSRVDTGLSRFSAVRSGDDLDRIVFSGPIGSPLGANRNNLGVWLSTDEGQTFGTPYQLLSGYTAYSDILTLQDGTIGIVYEATGNTNIRFINIDLTTLEGL